MALVIEGMPTMEIAQKQTEADALVQKVGSLIVRNERYLAGDWATIAVVADLVGGREATYGYVFMLDGDWEARIPSGFDVLDAFLELQAAMERQTGKKWLRALIHINRETTAMNIQFEYDDPTRWQIVPSKLEESVNALRP